MSFRRSRSCRALLAFVLGVCGALACVGTTPAPAGAAGPCPQGQLCVVVTQAVTGLTQVVTVTQVKDWIDIVERRYEVRSTAGGPTYTADLPPGLLSIRGLVVRMGQVPGSPFAGVDPDRGITYVAIDHPNFRQDLYLEPPDLGAAGENGFVDALSPALQLNDLQGDSDDQVGYIRPLRPGTQDVNAGDYFQAAVPLRITIATTGRPLYPTISKAPTEASNRVAADFEATLANAPVGTTYTWNFGDNTSGTGRTISHRFTTPSAGGYDVTVSVKAPDGSSGQSDARRVRVVDPGRVEPRIVPSTKTPTVEEDVRFVVELAERPTRYRWTLDGKAVSSKAELTLSFDDTEPHTIGVTVLAEGRPGADAYRIKATEEKKQGDKGDTDDDDDGSDSGDGSGTGSTTGGLNPDPNAPITGPDAGEGNQGGATPSQDPPTPPGSPTPPGGLTGILLTGATTPADAVPLPDASAADQGRQPTAPAARARTDVGGGGRTIQWGLGIVPLLLLAGVARESGWVSRLRTTWVRTS